MNSSSETDYADLVQIAQSSHKIQTSIEHLAQSINVKSIVEKEGYSKVECEYNEKEEEEQALRQIREEFKDDLNRDKNIIDIIKAIVPRPKTKYYLHYGVRLLVFQSGWSNLVELVPKDDCIILIPVVIDGTAKVTISEPTTGQETTFMLEIKSQLVISGRCSIRIQPGSKVVCVVLCIGKDKE
ncbi:hypothetical protein ACMFMG_012130 [Clarireedia jacksonii]